MLLVAISELYQSQVKSYKVGNWVSRDGAQF